MANDLPTTQFSPLDPTHSEPAGGAANADQDDDTGEARTIEVSSIADIDAQSFARNDGTNDAKPVSPATDAIPAPQPLPFAPVEHIEHAASAPAPIPTASPAQAAPEPPREPAEPAAPTAPAAPSDRKPRHAAIPELPDLRANASEEHFDPQSAQSRNEFTTVYDILDRIEATLDEAQTPLFQPNLVKVDRGELTEQLEELKKMLPVQLERASALMREAERRLEGAQTQANAIIAAAQSRAAGMIKDANDQAQFLAGQENVVALAQTRARITMDTAQSKADHLTNGADKYCVDVMESLDQQLDKLKQDVQAGLNVLYTRQQRAAQDYAATQAAVQGANDQADNQQEA